MKHRFLLAFAWGCLLPGPASGDVPLAGTTAHFASQDEARQILTSKDDYIQRMSPFDRAARMKTDRKISEDEFLQFVGKNVSDWTPAETQAVQTALEAIHPLLTELAFSLPRPVQFIKTTGVEEGNAAYTRAMAVILPKSELGKSQADLKKLICHELFHILSRQNPELREKLYGIIGFTKCNEVTLPPALARRKITNPDAPRNDHFIRVQIDGRETLVIPILLANAETYDVKRGGVFFEYLQLRFLVVEKDGGSGNFKPALDGSAPKLVGMPGISGFMEQVGGNTQYVIHPEEILADNFALLVLGESNVPSPEILRKMKEVLSQRTPR